MEIWKRGGGAWTFDKNGHLSWTWTVKPIPDTPRKKRVIIPIISNEMLVVEQLVDTSPMTRKSDDYRKSFVSYEILDEFVQLAYLPTVRHCSDSWKTKTPCRDFPAGRFESIKPNYVRIKAASTCQQDRQR